MRALFLNQFYHPDIAATAQVLRPLCEDLAAAGHHVTVVCSAAAYRRPHHGRDAASQPSVPAAQPQQIAGVTVLRIPLPPPGAAARLVSALASPVAALATRLGREAQFTLATFRRLRAQIAADPPDVIVAMSTPPTLLPVALWAAADRHIPVVYWVQDVYPDLLPATGVLQPERAPDRLAMAALSALMPRLYRPTAAAVVLDDAMRDRLVAGGFPADRVHVIEHGTDCRTVHPIHPGENRIRKLLGLTSERDFVVCYSGNMGRGHDFDTVAQALSLLARSASPAAGRVHFLFIGDGQALPSLRAAVPSTLQGRVHFLPPQDATLLGDVLSAGDVGLITLRPACAGLMTPSKLYPLLAAARPILYVGPPSGRVASLCDSDPIGQRIENGAAAALVDTVLRWADDPAGCAALGRTARALAESRFDRPLTSGRHAALLTRIATSTRAPGPEGREGPVCAPSA